MPDGSSFPPWHIGHVVWKLMLAHEAEEIQRGELAERADVRPMTITHMLRTGRSDDATVEKVARVFGCTALELKQEVERSNQHPISAPIGEQRRRVTDRDPLDVDAEQYARRLVRLPHDVQGAIFMAIRAFEGLLSRRNGSEP